VFGKSKKPKQVELTCPYCGNQQSEPAMAVSSFCRGCGDHFRIQKGVAVARPGLRVSGITSIRESAPEEPEEENEEIEFAGDTGSEPKEGEASFDAWLRSARGGESRSESLTKNDIDEQPGSNPIAGAVSAAGFFGLAPEEDEDVSEDLEEAGEQAEEEDEDAELGRESQGKETLAGGSMGALIGKLADEVEKKSFGSDGSKMPPNYVPPGKRGRHSDDNGNRTVRCFRCNHIQNVTRYATSTQCGRCSVYISLADYEIKSEKSQVLRTRGDVVVTKKGSVRNCEIACRNLTVYGDLNATIDCSGVVIFKHSAKVKGTVNCIRLVVERKVEVDFRDGLIAEQLEVSGTVSGEVRCSGEVKVHRHGVIDGNVSARAINVREGGAIEGNQTIDPDLKNDMPLKGGFDPSIIE